MEPVIKVRYKPRALLLLLSIAMTAGQPGNPREVKDPQNILQPHLVQIKTFTYRSTMMADFRCEIYPEETYIQKSEGSAGFAVTINGSPLEYRPEQHYKITLQAGCYCYKSGFMATT